MTSSSTSIMSSRASCSNQQRSKTSSEKKQTTVCHFARFECRGAERHHVGVGRSHDDEHAGAELTGGARWNEGDFAQLRGTVGGAARAPRTVGDDGVCEGGLFRPVRNEVMDGNSKRSQRREESLGDASSHR